MDHLSAPHPGFATASLPEVLWRVHSTAYGPTNPPVPTGAPDRSWGRFDIAGYATVYAAATAQGALAETLAYAIADPATTEAVADHFDDDPEPVAEQWAATGVGHLPVRATSARWRRSRALTRLRPGSGVTEVIDLSVSDSVGALRAAAQQWMPHGHPLRADPGRFDLSALTGADRVLTCALARWSARQRMPDGRTPAGVRYASRHGVDLHAYALWVDLGAHPPGTPVPSAVSSVVVPEHSMPIRADDPALLHAARTLGITAH